MTSKQSIKKVILKKRAKCRNKTLEGAISCAYHGNYTLSRLEIFKIYDEEISDYRNTQVIEFVSEDSKDNALIVKNGERYDVYFKGQFEYVK